MSQPLSMHPVARAKPEELERMWVSAAEISRETGWAPNYVAAHMRKYNKRGYMLAGRPAYYREDLEDVIRQLKEQQEKYPLAPSILPQTAQG